MKTLAPLILLLVLAAGQNEKSKGKGKSKDAGEKKDCDKPFDECPQEGECANLLDGTGKAKCMQEHKYQEECKCLCDLLTPPCNREPEEEEPPQREPENEEPLFEDEPPPPQPPVTCFPADARVRTNRGVMTMEQLLDDKNVKVETIDGAGKSVFTEILFWSHVEPTRQGRFLEFSTASGHKIQLSPNHLAYAVPCRGGPRTAKFAEKFTPGECTLVREGDSFVPSQITMINSLEKTGIYSLITPTGSIVVEDVAASCHAAFDNEPIVHFLAMNVYRVLQLLPQGMVNLVYGATDFRAAMATILESL